MAVKSLQKKCRAGGLQVKDKALIGGITIFLQLPNCMVHPRQYWHLLEHIENLFVADGTNSSMFKDS